ncbi:hypothetical protein [Amycolatopsis kentuckyensis]|uniref:hypothetical protein n=1 Tax=Amycolatopsis kentuckyensis TaxID=218823 RepID=UPI003569CE51
MHPATGQIFRRKFDMEASPGGLPSNELEEVPEVVVDPIDMIDPEADVVRILRPRSLMRMLLTLFRLRSERLRAFERGDMIIEVAQVLSDSNRGGRVTSQSADGDRWMVSVPSRPEAPTATAAEAR